MSALLKPSEFLARARAGHCGTTSDGGDCTIGESGTFDRVAKLMANLKMRDERCKDERNDPGLTLSCSNRYDPTPQMMKQAMRSCLSACDSCARCNYVSFSWHFVDCACPLALNRTRVIACRCVLPANARVLHRFVVRHVRHGKAPAPARWKLVSIPVGKCLYEPAAHRASGPLVAAGIEGEAARAAAAAGVCTAWPSKRHAHSMCVARTSHRMCVATVPQAESRALEWVQPHAAMRVALVLYGKVGTC